MADLPRWVARGSHPVSRAVVPEWAVVDGEAMAVFAQFPGDAVPEVLPVVVLSHGLGGSHLGYATLGAHLASHGFAVLHPQFLDSVYRLQVVESLAVVGGPGADNDEAVRAAMRPLLFDPQHWSSRVERVRALIDSLPSQSHLPVGLSPQGVTLVGHSYGAYVTQLLLGVRLFGVGQGMPTSAHPAVACGILLSPQGSGDRGLTDRSWEGVSAPLLEVTATQDFGPHGEGLAWRREPFDRARSARKHLSIVRGGDHYLGGIPAAEDDGPVPGTEHTTERGVRRAVSAVALALAQWARGDTEAGEWLRSGPIGSVFDHEHLDPGH